MNSLSQAPVSVAHPLRAIMLTCLMSIWCIIGSTALVTAEAAGASTEPVAPDPLTAAIERHAWRWFGLTLAAAEAKATAENLKLVVIERDGRVLAPHWTRGETSIGVVVHGDRIIEAQIGTEGDREGTRDLHLLPWLGQSEAAATALAQEHGRPLRVVARDGNHLAVTMDYRENRLNVHLQQGVVVAVYGG